MRLKEQAAARVRYGYRRPQVLLRREGWPVNAEHVHRLHREEGLLRGRPENQQVDNGPEFAGEALDRWVYLNGVEIDFSRPGNPRTTG
jgi:hypothetical protein